MAANPLDISRAISAHNTQRPELADERQQTAEAFRRIQGFAQGINKRVTVLEISSSGGGGSSSVDKISHPDRT